MALFRLLRPGRSMARLANVVLLIPILASAPATVAGQSPAPSAVPTDDLAELCSSFWVERAPDAPPDDGTCPFAAVIADDSIFGGLLAGQAVLIASVAIDDVPATVGTRGIAWLPSVAGITGHGLATRTIAVAQTVPGVAAGVAAIVGLALASLSSEQAAALAGKLHPGPDIRIDPSADFGAGAVGIEVFFRSDLPPAEGPAPGSPLGPWVTLTSGPASAFPADGQLPDTGVLPPGLTTRTILDFSTSPWAGPAGGIGVRDGRNAAFALLEPAPSGNQTPKEVSFVGVPIDPTDPAVGSRVVRITNTRGNANALGIAGANATPTPIRETLGLTPRQFLELESTCLPVKPPVVIQSDGKGVPRSATLPSVESICPVTTPTDPVPVCDPDTIAAGVVAVCGTEPFAASAAIALKAGAIGRSRGAGDGHRRAGHSTAAAAASLAGATAANDGTARLTLILAVLDRPFDVQNGEPAGCAPATSRSCVLGGWQLNVSPNGKPERGFKARKGSPYDTLQGSTFFYATDYAQPCRRLPCTGPRVLVTVDTTHVPYKVKPTAGMLLLGPRWALWILPADPDATYLPLFQMTTKTGSATYINPLSVGFFGEPPASRGKARLLHAYFRPLLVPVAAPSP